MADGDPLSISGIVAWWLKLVEWWVGMLTGSTGRLVADALIVGDGAGGSGRHPGWWDAFAMVVVDAV
jgi:hypothetical protein